jgi:hypothetical protein
MRLNAGGLAGAVAADQTGDRAGRTSKESSLTAFSPPKDFDNASSLSSASVIVVLLFQGRHGIRRSGPCRR